jgi:predicted ATPase
MSAPVFLERVFVRPDAKLRDDEFPATLSFVRDLDIRFTHAVTFLVGENGSGKSTVTEAIADLSGLPVGGGGRNELADLRTPHGRSELAPFLRAAFRKRPREGYFFRAEFQAHFASLLEQRKADPDFWEDPYARYGGQSLHTRTHDVQHRRALPTW